LHCKRERRKRRKGKTSKNWPLKRTSLISPPTNRGVTRMVYRKFKKGVEGATVKRGLIWGGKNKYTCG